MSAPTGASALRPRNGARPGSKPVGATPPRRDPGTAKSTMSIPVGPATAAAGGQSSEISASRMTAASLPPNVERNTVMPAKSYSGGASFISRCIVPVRFVASRR